jgi:hypothetical protein
MTYRLTPFDVADASVIATWMLDADDVHAATDERTFPVTASAVLRWTLECDGAFVLLADDVQCGYAEIWVDEVEGDVQIAHCVVSPLLMIAREELMRQMSAQVRTAFPNYEFVWTKVRRARSTDLDAVIAAGFIEDKDASGPNVAWLRKDL